MTVTELEKRILSAAMRLEYWYMRPTKRAEANKTLGRLLKLCAARRKMLGK